jgi:hypothetical protein
VCLDCCDLIITVTAQVKSRPYKVNGKAVPKRVGVNVNVDHAAIFLDGFKLFLQQFRHANNYDIT